MILTQQLKENIITAIQADFDRKKAQDSNQNYARHANYLGLDSSRYSRIVGGQTEKILSEGEWVRIGMELLVNLQGLDWQTADTPTTQMITTQLDYCKDNSMSAIFCDDKGIGKSYTAKVFKLENANVCFVDCSQNHTKREMIRAIARGFGFDWKGKLKDIKTNMVYNILALDRPILILDEAGDLSYEAWLEIKSLWNSLEGMCGFYMLGANGLKAKIDRHISNYKVGYEEIFDRFGDRYQAITKDLGDAEKIAFKREQALAVLRVNLPGLTASVENSILSACNLNLRRLQIEIIKYKNAQMN